MNPGTPPPHGGVPNHRPGGPSGPPDFERKKKTRTHTERRSCPMGCLTRCRCAAKGGPFKGLGLQVGSPKTGAPPPPWARRPGVPDPSIRGARRPPERTGDLEQPSNAKGKTLSSRRPKRRERTFPITSRTQRKPGTKVSGDEKNKNTTLSSGSLGSRVDEERSQLRDLV